MTEKPLRWSQADSEVGAAKKLVLEALDAVARRVDELEAAYDREAERHADYVIRMTCGRCRQYGDGCVCSSEPMRVTAVSHPEVRFPIRRRTD